MGSRPSRKSGAGPAFDWTGFVCPCWGVVGGGAPPEPNPDEDIAAYEASLHEDEPPPPCFNTEGRFDPDRVARAYALDGARSDEFPGGTDWAFNCVFDMAYNHPLQALELIRLAAGLAMTDKQSCMIGCGNLESLLGKHSKLVLGEVERIARQDAAFRECLSHVWQHGMPDDHWHRVLVASGRIPLR